MCGLDLKSSENASGDGCHNDGSGDDTGEYETADNVRQRVEKVIHGDHENRWIVAKTPITTRMDGTAATARTRREVVAMLLNLVMTTF